MMETVYLIVDSDRVFDEPYLRWSVVLVSPMFGVISAACSTGRMGTHTTMVTGHVLTISGLLGLGLLRKDPRFTALNKTPAYECGGASPWF